MMQELYKMLLEVIRKVDFLQSVSKPLAALAMIIGILLLARIAHSVTKYILSHWVMRLVSRTKNEWDDILARNKVFSGLSHLAPLFIIYSSCFFATPTLERPLAEMEPAVAAQMTADFYFSLGPFLLRLARLYFLFTLVYIIITLLNAANAIYQTTPYSLHRPIKGYIQLLQILAYFLSAIIGFSLLLGKDPTVLIAGLGAMAAVLMLIFKDTILGFVASIQLSANEMVKIGDWVEMPSHRADGTVIDLTLTTVKVQNWDRTITTIPTYALVSESFINWKGMEESEGRRIKRSIYIDLYSIRFCTPGMLEHFKKFDVIRDYVTNLEEEILRYNKKHKISDEDVLTGRRQTNIGVFRKYLELHLKANPRINDKMTFIIRQLQPTEKGLPMEIYAFSKIKAWGDYEALQNDIFDQIFAVIPEFGLKIFQSPAGNDMRTAFQMTQQAAWGTADPALMPPPAQGYFPAPGTTVGAPSGSTPATPATPPSPADPAEGEPTPGATPPEAPRTKKK